MTTELTKLLEYLRSLMQSRFYGKVIVTIQDGRITMLKTEQTMKIESLGEKEDA